nr:hypothetical protein [Deltaproteobacteria bacterium]
MRASLVWCCVAFGLAGCTRPPRSQPAPDRARATQAAVVPTADLGAVEPAVVDPPAEPRRAEGWERFVPPLDAPTRAHVRELFARGAAAGLRPDVFSKLGDSITESGSFAQDIGHGWYELGAFTELEPVIAWFRRRSPRSGDDNSFTRGSAAATAGWESSQLLE